MQIHYLGPEGTFTELGAEILEKKVKRKLKLKPEKSVEEIARLLKLPRPMKESMKLYCQAHEHFESTEDKDCKYAKMLKEIAKTVRAPIPNDDLGVIAYYNALEGPVMKNLDIIFRHKLGIVDMIRVPISFAIGTHKKPLKDFNIYSHEFALAQCSDFIREHYPSSTQLMMPSTAKAVEALKDGTGGLAIARKDSLEKAGMRIIADDIGNRVNGSQNFTDMFVVSAIGKTPSKDDSLTMMAITPHFDRVNLLGEILYKHIGKLGINVTRLYSRPAMEVNLVNNETPQMFYLELEANPREQRFRRCVYELTDLLNHKGKEVVRVLGSYPKP